MPRQKKPNVSAADGAPLTRRARREKRQQDVAAYKGMSRKDRRKARKAGGGGEKKADKDKWGPPLGQGEPFDNDPNTMFSYFNPPQTFDFNDYEQYGGAPGDFNDPYNVFLSTVPIMERETYKNIGKSLSGFGQSGNRYSAEAMRSAADIGAQSTERQNAMLNQLLYQQTNADLDRQMAASMGYINASPQVEDAMGARLGFNYQMANQAQNALERANAQRLSAANADRAAFEKNKYGNLPFLGQFLSHGIGQGPEPILNTGGGKQGYGADIMKLMAMFA